MKLRHWVRNSLRSLTSPSAEVIISPLIPKQGIWAGRQAQAPEHVGILTYIGEEHLLDIARFCALRCSPVPWALGGEEWQLSEERFARLIAELSKFISDIHIDARWLDKTYPTFEARLKRYGVITRREYSLDESDSRSAA